MNKFFEGVEHYNIKLIPYAVVVLLGIIIFELFFHTENETILLLVHILDFLVITIFVIDLVFLGRRAKSVKFFFKNYWLDVIAIFPFSIAFTVVSRLYRVLEASERLAVGQAIVHEGLEVRKGVKGVALLTKGGQITRLIRISARLLRVITKTRLFTRFHHKHHKSNVLVQR